MENRKKLTFLFQSRVVTNGMRYGKKIQLVLQTVNCGYHVPYNVTQKNKAIEELVCIKLEGTILQINIISQI